MKSNAADCRITLHMVSSVDGFIAKKDNSISWFEASSQYDKGVDGQNPEQFLKTIDCYIMGSRTYELALELSTNYGWPYGDTPTIVLSNRILPNERPNVEFYAGDLNKLVADKLAPIYKTVWVVGGSSLAKDFIQHKLVNEIRVSILPIILGEGLLYFDHIRMEQKLHLKDTTAYKNGMVELHYEIIKE